MEALSLRSQGMPTRDIMRLCGISNASVHRSLKAYVIGGMERVKDIEHYRPHRDVATHRSTIDASVREHPPATVAEAAATIKELTGIARTPTQVRQCLPGLGMKPRNVGL